MRNLNEEGRIAEISSRRYGEFPDLDIKREKLLLRWSWLWFLMPFVGFMAYAIDRDELTDRWGHFPWWL